MPRTTPVAPDALDVAEWHPPTLPPLPTDIATPGVHVPVDRLESVALGRCKLRGDTLRENGTLACKRCMTEVLTGRDPLTTEAGPIDVDALLGQFPPPGKGWTRVHRRLLEVLADRNPRDEKAIKALCGDGYATDSIPARLRDLRQFGYPIGRKTEAGRSMYWLAI